MGLNRRKDFCRRIRKSESQFDEDRRRPAGDPERIPEPDGWINDGHNPVWTDETVERHIAGVLEHSRATKAAAKLHKRRASSELGAA